MAVCCGCLYVRRGEVCFGRRQGGVAESEWLILGRSLLEAANNDEGAQSKEGPTTGSVLPVCVCVRKRSVVGLEFMWCMKRRIRNAASLL